MQFKFRPSVEALDSRDLPSTTPIDTSALDQALLQSVYADGQLSQADLEALLGGIDLGAYDLTPDQTTDSFTTELDAYLSDNELTTAELETLLGAALAGEPDQNPGDPPREEAPPPVGVFSPVPPLSEVIQSSITMPNLDYTGAGGNKASDAEAAEVLNLLTQIKAIDVGITATKALKSELIFLMAGKNGDVKRLEKLVAEKARDYDLARTVLDGLDIDNPASARMREIVVEKRIALETAQEALALIRAERNNVLDRVNYLDGKIKELETLRTRLQGRVDVITSNLKIGQPVGPSLNYQLPSFIDWTGAAWNDFSKPTGSLRAAIPR